MTYPTVVHSIMGLYSHSYGVCIKVFMAVSGEEFRQMKKLVSNCACYIHKYYNSAILYYRLVLFI